MCHDGHHTEQTANCPSFSTDLGTVITSPILATNWEKETLLLPMDVVEVRVRVKSFSKQMKMIL